MRWAILITTLGWFGCSVGQGEGEISGRVQAPGCGLSPDDTYEMNPTFFAGEVIEEQFIVRVQSISDFEDKTDGVIISVSDAARVQQEFLNTPMPLGDTEAEVPIRAVFYANETCKVERRETPVAYSAVSGSITFENIHAPRVSDIRETTATFSGRFEDSASPNERYAELVGYFSFLYTRGRPAQRFP